MQLLNLITLITLVNYNSANALPDTNIHIQHYDGPVYMSTPKPSCCPICNSPLKPERIDNTNDPCEPAPETVYPETTVYIKYPVAEETKEESCGKSSRNCKSNPPIGNTSHGTYITDNKSNVSGNYGTMLHTDATKKGTGTHDIAVTCRSPYGNTYTGSGNANSLATHFGYDTYGTCYPSVATEPLSSYLPVTASQNSCYQVPILTCNSDQGGEPTLVPQKFMYSLILDGEVAANQNGYNYKSSYY